MLQIDGSHGEGGGQLLRTVLSLAAITRTPVRVVNVRARRDKPGLAPQHLAAVRAVGAICGASVQGAALRSTELSFSPGTTRGGEYRFDIGTAGSVTLVLQALLPAMAASAERFHTIVTGGTDVRAAPPVDYLREVLLALLARMGLQVRLEVRRRGYYPRGGGEVELECRAARPRALSLATPAEFRRVRGIAHVANLPEHIATRMRSAALDAFGPVPGVDTEISTAVLGRAAAIGPGGAIVAWAHTGQSVLGAGRVAERGVRAEALGGAVGAELRQDGAAGVTLDVHAADQLPVYLALARGESSFTTRVVSSHAQTAMWLIEQFLPVRFEAVADGHRFRVTARPR